MKPALIKFIPPTKGGREALPPGHHYTTIVAPEGERPSWSLVMEWDGVPTVSEWSPCEVNYLSYSHPKCPPLTPGTMLNVFEGHRLVAHIEVTE